MNAKKMNSVSSHNFGNFEKLPIEGMEIVFLLKYKKLNSFKETFFVERTNNKIPL